MQGLDGLTIHLKVPFSIMALCMFLIVAGLRMRLLEAALSSET